MSAIVLDAGAFIAWERGDPSVRAHLEAARRIGFTVQSPSPVVAQVWRDGARQARLSTLLPAIEVAAPDLADAKAAGVLLRQSLTDDVIDALVVLNAPSGSTILTSDVGDIGALVAATRRRISVVRV